MVNFIRTTDDNTEMLYIYICRDSIITETGHYGVLPMYCQAELTVRTAPDQRMPTVRTAPDQRMPTVGTARTAPDQRMPTVRTAPDQRMPTVSNCA